jgi:hypothetical protein
LEGHERLQLGSDLGKDLDPDSHASAIVGVKCRGIAVGIRLPSRLLESGATVDKIHDRQFRGKGEFEVIAMETTREIFNSTLDPVSSSRVYTPHHERRTI